MPSHDGDCKQVFCAQSFSGTRYAAHRCNTGLGMPPIRPSPLRLYRSILVAHRRVLPPAVRTFPMALSQPLMPLPRVVAAAGLPSPQQATPAPLSAES